jgi:hypothetical protein
LQSVEHAVRQADLYGGIWAADPDYGTREADVRDTVHHRIGPHMQRVIGLPVDLAVDFGAGDGRFLRAMHAAGLIRAGVGVDVHEPMSVPSWLQWRRQTLWAPLYVCADYAISTDTLEHMPAELVPDVLARIRAAAPHGFLRISNREDHYGTERGLHLHETVAPPEWWLERLQDFGLHSWRIYPGHAMEVWY